MATDFALRLMPPTAQHTEVAADWIRGVLGRDFLFAVWASALPFDPGGPQGVELASQALFHRPPQALDWERAAELVVASGAFDQVSTCKNPPHLRAMRDKFLAQAAEVDPESANEIKGCGEAAFGVRDSPQVTMGEGGPTAGTAAGSSSRGSERSCGRCSNRARPRSPHS